MRLSLYQILIRNPCQAPQRSDMQIPGITQSTDSSSFSWETLIAVIIIVVVAYAVGRIAAYLVQRLWLRPRKVELSTDILVTRVITWSITIIGALMALSYMKLDITPLLLGAGIVGLAIAFGVQEIVANLISGLIIMVDRPIRVGDIVEVETATGRVMDVGLRASTVRTLDNVNHLIPNKLIILNRITNYSKYDPKIRLQISIGVAYGSDMEKVRKTLLSIAEKHPKVLDDPPPEVRITEFGNSSVDFILFAWIDDPSSRIRIKDEINWEIDQEFRKQKITIPFPQLDVWMKK
jgi:small-conductance mechanosensitive channel